MSVLKSMVWLLVASTAASLVLVTVAGGQSPTAGKPRVEHAGGENLWSSVEANTADLGTLDLLDELTATVSGPALTIPTGARPATAFPAQQPSRGAAAKNAVAPTAAWTPRSPGYVSLNSSSMPAQLSPPVIASRRQTSQPKRPRAQSATHRASNRSSRARQATKKSSIWRPTARPKTASTAARLPRSSSRPPRSSPKASSRSSQGRVPRFLPPASGAARVASQPWRRGVSRASEAVGPSWIGPSRIGPNWIGPSWIGSDEPWDTIYEDGAFGDAGCGLYPCRQRGWVTGAEYLLIRPHFSEARAFSCRELAVPNSNPSVQTETTVDFDYAYQSSLRTYIGYRLDDCGSEFRATYTRLRGDSSVSATAITGVREYTAYEINAITTGQTITANNDVFGNVYDIEISRSIRSSNACNGGGCSSCQAWDLQWSAGFRIADMGYDTLVAGPTTGGTGTIDIQMDFIGAGPMVGLKGQRHFGRRRQFSTYADWDLALLLGHYEHALTRTNNQSLATNVTRFDTDLTRVVPMTEIEIGVRWQARPRLTISAGWMVQVWWDLGMTEDEASSFDSLAFLRDDSNIMSWDGLTIRGELAF